MCGVTFPDKSDETISTPFLFFNMTLNELTNLQLLNECTIKCTKQSKWKESTQRYIANMMENNFKLRNEVLSHTYRIRPTTNFVINERGKTRYIEAPQIRDRVIQKTVTENLLIPLLRPYMIYDNYASLKGRGTSFARKRFEAMLRKFINKHGRNGYIMLIDIKKYFDNIDHNMLKIIIKEKLKNEPDDIKDLVDMIIDFGSSTNKGLNIGSEAPQILAVYYLNTIDTFIKIVKHIKYYGRYMDDMFIISENKNELHGLLEDIKMQISNLNLQINERKTTIIKLTHGFTYLQIKYNITNTGNIIKRMSHKKVVRERRRLKKYSKRYNEGRMSYKDIEDCYKSWRGCIIKDHTQYRNSLKNLDELYLSLFGKKFNDTVKTKRSRRHMIDESFNITS